LCANPIGNRAPAAGYVGLFSLFSAAGVRERGRREGKEKGDTCALDVFDDEVVHHAVKIDEEEKHEVDELGKRHVLVELKLCEHLSRINTILLCVENVAVPCCKRNIDEEFKPVTTKKEKSGDCGKGDHLVGDERIKTFSKIYRIQINIKIAKRHE